jgi:inner membrane protein
MPLTTTHALVPLAGALAFARAPLRWPLIVCASLAAAIPDLDGLTNPVWADTWGLPTTSIYAHRGATHSLFFALLLGLIAAAFYKRFAVRPLTAAVVVGSAAASHGILDMMTNSGRPVAILWPLSSVRVFADWRPIQSFPVPWHHFFKLALERQQIEFWQLILPMFTLALAVRLARRSAGIV